MKRRRKSSILLAVKAADLAVVGASAELQSVRMDLRKACVHTEITNYWKAYKKNDRGGQKVSRGQEDESRVHPLCHSFDVLYPQWL